MVTTSPAWYQPAIGNANFEASHHSHVMPAPGVSILYPSSYIISTTAVSTANWVTFPTV